ncbi:dUTP diphosphatase [uncultured Rothia sp.]|uniref:dUTP diphosphatase n=1 Tax=uncultured Rothia sp. TaxID=316088 RepID=UPI003216B9CA
MIKPIDVQLHLLDSELPVPSYAKDGDAGVDLRSRETLTLMPGQRALIRTGVAIALPPGYVGLVHPRSGLATKYGITVVNAPGTIDSGYRGEIMVCLLNTDQSESFAVAKGDRIAQLIVQRFETVRFVSVDNLAESERGVTGFGSSGVR